MHAQVLQETHGLAVRWTRLAGASVRARPGPRSSLACCPKTVSPTQRYLFKQLLNLHCRYLPLEDTALRVITLCNILDAKHQHTTVVNLGITMTVRKPSENINTHGKSTTLYFTLLNFRSAVKHRQEIHDICIDNRLDCLLITESWLTENSGADIHTLLPPSHKIIIKNRPLR